jgi:hypothetical protein
VPTNAGREIHYGAEEIFMLADRLPCADSDSQSALVCVCVHRLTKAALNLKSAANCGADVAERSKDSIAGVLDLSPARGRKSLPHDPIMVPKECQCRRVTVAAADLG